MNTEQWDDFEIRLKEIAKLKKGWYWDNTGKPVSADALATLRTILKKMEETIDLPRMILFPGMDDVHVNWFSKNWHGTLIVQNSGVIEAFGVSSINDGYCEIAEKTVEETVETLVEWFTNPNGTIHCVENKTETAETANPEKETVTAGNAPTENKEDNNER